MNKEILEALQDTVRLLAVLVKRDKSQQELIQEMNEVGFAPKRIAEMLGTSSNSVSVALHIAKKKKKGRK